VTLVLSKSKPQNGRVYIYNTCSFQELKENFQGTSATPREHFTLCACVSVHACLSKRFCKMLYLHKKPKFAFH